MKIKQNKEQQQKLFLENCGNWLVYKEFSFGVSTKTYGRRKEKLKKLKRTKRKGEKEEERQIDRQKQRERDTQRQRKGGTG